MVEAPGDAVNCLKLKEKVDVGKAMPIARVLAQEDARDLTMEVVTTRWCRAGRGRGLQSEGAS